MRPDLEIIQQWIEPGSRVLDLGCGDGSLLTYLNAAKKDTTTLCTHTAHATVVVVIAVARSNEYVSVAHA